MGKKIGVLGSIALDNIFSAESLPLAGERIFGKLLGRHIGGMAANQAVEAAKYHGDVYIIGVVGDDPEGDRICRHMEKMHVDTSRLIRDGSLCTGQTYMFLTEGNADYFSVVDMGANKTEEESEILERVKDMDVLLISLEIGSGVVQHVLTYAKEHKIYTYLCCSPAEVCSQNLMEKADALIANRREAKMLLGLEGDSVEEIIKNLRKQEIAEDKLLLVSLGEQGAVLKAGEEIYYAKGIDVRVLDSVGAGDAFAGAFVANREMGMDIRKALCYGCIAGGFTVSAVGAQSSRHTMADVEECYRKNYE